MTEVHTYQLPEPPTRRRIVWATVLALGVAALLLVTCILPAEYGIDPLGAGRALGLMDVFEAGLSEEGVVAAQTLQTGPSPTVSPQPAAFITHTREFKVGPLEWVEFKYRLQKGGGLVYSWKATGKVGYEFHGEPDGAKKGYADTYDKSEAVEGHGTFNAPTTGIHGWYWENLSDQEITISLNGAGFFYYGVVFNQDGTSRVQDFQPEPASAPAP